MKAIPLLIPILAGTGSGGGSSDRVIVVLGVAALDTLAPDNTGTQPSSWGAVIQDTHDAWDPGLGLFQAPASGLYTFEVGVVWHVLSPSAACRLERFINGSNYVTISTTQQPQAEYSVHDCVWSDYLEAGDTVGFQVYQESGDDQSFFIAHYVAHS